MANHNGLKHVITQNFLLINRENPNFVSLKFDKNRMTYKENKLGHGHSASALIQRHDASKN